MINRYRFGEPIETDAVLNKPLQEKGQINYLSQNGNSFSYRMDNNDIVYGLGENVRGINKRGWIYESNCTDDPIHREDVRSLYGAHNFIIVDGKESFGIFIDTPSSVIFDIGYTRMEALILTVRSDDYEIYMIEGNSPDTIVNQFRTLIGRSYIPPKWAFGYGQSRWSYETADEVREVARLHRENHIPLDSIYLDIDYMERYKDFTINTKDFPDFETFVQEMKDNGIHLVPIIDGGVKIEEGYDIYEEGIANDYFCKDEKNENFVVGVWPGKCLFPDMLNEDAGRWFGDKYKILLDKGIEGFWNDMNEPAIFYSEKRLKKVFSQLERYRNMNLDVNTFFELQDLVATISKNPEDYASFYHNYKGKKIRHDKVHNLFGYYMTRSAGEAFDRLEPDKRILLFSRASYIGMHRYGGIWTGDNLSWWSHILLNIKMMPSLNMCGFLYTGADIGGFGSDVTEDLLLRWMAVGIFTPLMRNHAAKGTRRQEVYRFEKMEQFRNLIALRYRLLPYIYSEFIKAAVRGGMYCRPLGFLFPGDKIARRIEDQLMIGESVMIAPVYEQNAIGRNIYLPEEMKQLRFKNPQVIEEQIIPKGYHYVEIGLDEVVIFIRKGYLLPLAEAAESVDGIDYENLKVYHYAETGQNYELYNDDGYCKEIDLNKNIRNIVI